MKRTLLVLVLPLLLGGCAQVFDSNAFAGVDGPPPVNLSELKKATPDEIRNKMKDSSFLQQLKDNPAALVAAQSALNNTINSDTATDEQKLSAGATLVELTSSASGVSDMKTAAVKKISTISDAVSAGNYAKALKIFMGDQNEKEIVVTLGNLKSMGESLAVMQKASKKSDGTLDAKLFYSGTTDRSSFAQSALMAAIATALIADTGSIDVLAADLALDEPRTGSNGTDMSEFVAAKDADAAVYTVAEGTSSASQYCYTYVATVVPELAFDL